MLPDVDEPLLGRRPEQGDRLGRSDISAGTGDDSATNQTEQTGGAHN
jgi:hypothetical protein